ncbi:EpsG family protein [Pseudoalteromonas sp. 2CM36K]|uniref:EpsG family protein n=1 Tax=Pseudoalteromonas sp. 2CM36K TaxID=2929854 RepID=UPI0020BF8D8B|nr:EpsG family protein [Pseudoalteromonas sp. 2CM36K]MCK8104714.1 EpsG family protein [Pseudoalteromonas sp. 2CM36K]
MFPYFIVLIISVSSLAVGLWLKGNKQPGSNLFFFFALSPLIALAALRAEWVGTDTYTYLWFWNTFTTAYYDKSGLLFSEPLFAVLQHMTRFLADNTFLEQEVFLGAISLIVCALTFSAILTHSAYKVMSWTFFILLGFYTFHFNGARQAIAIALFLYSTKYILNGNLLKYLVLVLIGFLVHKTMLICFPLYFIFRKELNAKQVLLVVMGAVMVALSVTTLVDFASQYDQRYQSYAKSDFEGAGLVVVLFNTSLLMWLWVSKRLNAINDKLYDISLLAMLIAVCIGWVSVILSLNPSGILRLSVYFTQLSIFSLPMSVLYFKNAGTRSFVLLSVLTVAGLYFYLTTTSFSGLAPYKLGVDLHI